MVRSIAAASLLSFLAACSSSSNPTPSGTVTVTALPTTIKNDGSSSAISVTVSDSKGQPVVTGTVNISANAGFINGKDADDVALSATGATATFTCPSCSAGAKTVSANWGGIGGNAQVDVTRAASTSTDGGTDGGSDAGTVTDAGVVSVSSSIAVVGASPAQVFTAEAAASGLPIASTITFQVKDANGNPVSGVVVKFAQEFGENLIALSPSSSATDADGLASVLVTASSTPGTAHINGTTALGARAQASLPIVGKPASVRWVSSAPDVLGLRGSGIQESGVMTFLVTDAFGAPVPNAQVDFSVTFPALVLLNAASGRSDGSGKVSVGYTARSDVGITTIQGTLHQVPAPSDANKVTGSHQVAVRGARPSAKGFFFQCDKANLPVYESDALQQMTCHVRLADRYGNRVGIPTPVHFAAEAGAIAATVVTKGFDPASPDNTAEGTVDVTFTADIANGFGPADVEPNVTDGEPWKVVTVGLGASAVQFTVNPRDNLVSLIAWTQGEEAFVDANHNGQYDLGELFVDEGDPFLDENDDNQYDRVSPGGQWEPYFCGSTASVSCGAYNPPNGKWDELTTIWTPTWVVFSGPAQASTAPAGSTSTTAYTPGCADFSDSGLDPLHGSVVKAPVYAYDFWFNTPSAGTNYSVLPTPVGSFATQLTASGEGLETQTDTFGAFGKFSVDFDYVLRSKDGKLCNTTNAPSGDCALQLQFYRYDSGLRGNVVVSNRGIDNGVHGCAPNTAAFTQTLPFTNEVDVVGADGKVQSRSYFSGTFAYALPTPPISGSLALSVVSVSPSSVPLNGSATITFGVFNTDPFNPIPVNGLTVTFANANGENNFSLSQTSTQTDTSGVVRVVATPIGAPGIGHVVATLQSTGVTAVASLSVVGLATSIRYLSSSPDVLGLKGSGIQENGVMMFQVTDAYGSPIAGAPVSFDVLPAGLVAVNASPILSDANGTVQVGYRSTATTQVGVSTVRATINPATNPATATHQIAVRGARPSAKGFYFRCVNGNLQVYDTISRYAQTTCTVRLTDRYGNRVGIATPVQFATEAGAITATAFTTPFDPLAPDNALEGTVQVTFTANMGNGFGPQDVAPLAGEPSRSANGLTYNPRDNLVTVIAWTQGEEAFVDSNNNGVYDPGESFVDEGDPFIDANDNDAYDPATESRFCGAIASDCVTYHPPNGQWDGLTTIWTPTWVVFSGAPTPTSTAAGAGAGGAAFTPFGCADFFDIPYSPAGHASDIHAPIYVYDEWFNSPAAKTVYTSSNLVQAAYSAAFLSQAGQGFETETENFGAMGQFGTDFDYRVVQSSTGAGICSVLNQAACPSKFQLQFYRFDNGYRGDLVVSNSNSGGSIFGCQPTAGGTGLPAGNTLQLPFTSRFDVTGTNGTTHAYFSGLYAYRLPASPTPASLSIAAAPAAPQVISYGAGSASGVPTSSTLTFTVTANGGSGSVANIPVTFTEAIGETMVAPVSGSFPITLTTDSVGQVSLVVRSLTTPGIAHVIGTVTGGANITATVNIVGPPATVNFIAGATEVLGIQGSGIQETGVMTFLVTDQFGTPVPNATVNFAQSLPQILTLNATSSATDGSGKVFIGYSSGPEVGINSVEAFTGDVSAGATFNNSPHGSHQVAVRGARPSASGFYFRCDHGNLRVYDIILGYQVMTCHVRLSDRFGNRVGISTPVHFASESGAIAATAYTVPFDPAKLDNTAEGTVDVTFTTDQGNGFNPADVDPFPGEPSYKVFDGAATSTINPRDHLVTIIAWTQGEEAFVDQNHDGQYTPGELFVDEGDPFIDANDDNVYDQVNGSSTQWEVRFCGSATSTTCPQYQGPNGKWDALTTIWTPQWVVFSGWPAPSPFDILHATSTLANAPYSFSPICIDYFDAAGPSVASVNVYAYDRWLNTPIAGTTYGLPGGPTAVDPKFLKLSIDGFGTEPENFGGIPMTYGSYDVTTGGPCSTVRPTKCQLQLHVAHWPAGSGYVGSMTVANSESIKISGTSTAPDGCLGPGGTGDLDFWVPVTVNSANGSLSRSFYGSYGYHQ